MLEIQELKQLSLKQDKLIDLFVFEKKIILSEGERIFLKNIQLPYGIHIFCSINFGILSFKNYIEIIPFLESFLLAHRSSF